METEMKVSLVNLTSTALTFALVVGIYIASAYGPECGMIDTLLGFCGS
jgi:hypothetical protein